MKFVYLLLVLSLTAGCAAGQHRYVWPQPPAAERYEWIGSYSASEDMPAGTLTEELLSFILDNGNRHILSKPSSVAVRGDIAYVSDLAGNALRFDFKKRQVDRLGGNSFTAVTQPSGLALDTGGLVYLVDAAERTVSVFNGENTLIHSFGLPPELKQPGRPAITAGRFYLPDLAGNKIHVFNLEGKQLTVFGREGNGPGEFRRPTAVAVAPDGTIAVADAFNARIQLFDASHNHRASFGGRGSNMVRLPTAIAYDGAGRLYIADAILKGVVIVDSGGELLMTLGAPHTGGELEAPSPGGFMQPSGIAFDGNILYVVDQINSNLQLFRYVGK